MAQVVGSWLSRSAMKSATAVDAAGLSAVALTPGRGATDGWLDHHSGLHGHRRRRPRERHQLSTDKVVKKVPLASWRLESRHTAGLGLA